MSIFSNFTKRERERVPFHAQPVPLYKGKLSFKNISQIFSDCSDFQSRKIDVGLNETQTLTVCWLDGVVDSVDVGRDVLRPLTDFMRAGNTLCAERVMNGAVYALQGSVRETLDDAVTDITQGCVLIVFEGEKKAVSFEIRSKLTRAVSEPQIEKSLKGGKDSFVESLRGNTSLVRRHIFNPALKCKNALLGRKSQTRACVMYLDGVADPDTVRELERRLARIDIDGALSTAAIESYIVDRPRSLFPQLIHTERPDRFCQQLLNGRVGLIVDGIPIAFVLPVSFAEFLRVPQDESQHWLISTALGTVRWLAVFLALTLPALYVAIANYHQEMIPTKLLISIVASKQDVPLSTSLEVLGMLLAFELLQEAGLRLPNPISDTASIIGALIVGQSAVEAKVISPIAVIVVAVAGIAGYAQPSQDLASALRLCRFGLVICAILGGLFAVNAALCLLVWYLCTIDSFGLNYTAPLSGARRGNVADTFLRRPKQDDILRDPDLNTPDKRRQR